DTPPETVGDNHSPEVREKLESEAFPEAVKEGYWRGESAIKGPGGEDIPVDQIIMAHYNESGEVAWFSTIARDISHRKEVEEKLKDQTVELAEGKAQDEAILRSLGEGLLVTNAEGDITFVNGAFEDLLGWDQSEVIGRKVSDVVPMRTENGVLVPFEEQILTHILSKSEERVIAEEVYYFFRKNGKQFPVAITVTPIILDGEPIGAVEVFRDITREREIDKAKTEFVSLASHQLRTPLSTINWYAEMLLSGDAGEITPQQQKFLDQVHTSSQRMVQLVNGLLNVSRIEMGNLAVDPEPTDLRELARSVLKEQQLQIKDRNLSHKEEFAEDVPKITLDASLMHIVFQNLISNAVKYTPEGGQFGVVIHRVSAGDEIEGTRIKKDSVLAVVWDHGYGIPDRQKDQIFSKLFRADNIKEKDTTGTGLGLYIVKAVVDGADGQIWFASTEGKGTSFFVAIPLEGMERREGTKGLILSDY
ncbi:MAG: PAS domain-containing sensor histidine kinase, partial [Candidatus Paceibacterota bacterium]